MGLAQRRIITEYKEKEYPKWKSQLDAAAGFDVPLEVKWDTLSNDTYEDRDLYFKCFDAVYFRCLLTVIKNICVDEMGKTAFREHVKKITIDGTEGYGPYSGKFENGQFNIRHVPFSNVDQEADRIRYWQKEIEQKL